MNTLPSKQSHNLSAPVNDPQTAKGKSMIQLQPGKVIPFGYACDSSMTKLMRLMRDKKAYLVDIRLSPHSTWHRAFNKAALAKRFPKRYVHMPELGNLHYRPQDRKKGIKIANPERGIARLMKGLSQGRTLILLCACKNKGCHRWTVITLLEEAMPDMPIEHLIEIG
jgi:hypothetical protein